MFAISEKDCPVSQYNGSEAMGIIRTGSRINDTIFTYNCYFFP